MIASSGNLLIGGSGSKEKHTFLLRDRSDSEGRTGKHISDDSRHSMLADEALYGCYRLSRVGLGIFEYELDPVTRLRGCQFDPPAAVDPIGARFARQGKDHPHPRLRRLLCVLAPAASLREDTDRRQRSHRHTDSRPYPSHHPSCLSVVCVAALVYDRSFADA